jgi:hypothetical protein
MNPHMRKLPALKEERGALVAMKDFLAGRR